MCRDLIAVRCKEAVTTVRSERCVERSPIHPPLEKRVLPFHRVPAGASGGPSPVLTASRCAPFPSPSLTAPLRVRQRRRNGEAGSGHWTSGRAQRGFAGEGLGSCHRLQTSGSGFQVVRVSVAMEEPEMQLKGKKVTDKFTESVYVLANEPSVALYRLQEHVRRSLPELAQHKADMQRWEEQSQGAIYTVEYACSAVKNLVDSSVYFRSVEGLLKQAISIRDHMNATQSHR